MSRELTEEGPRLEVHFSDDELTGLEEGLDAAAYERQSDPTGREIRYRHAGGSTVRIFPLSGLLYVYPPGGTRSQRGPIEPFTPLKRECGAANETWQSRAAGASGDEGPATAEPATGADDADAEPTGDPSTDDDEATDADDDESGQTS